jgi:hypothetical protein
MEESELIPKSVSLDAMKDENYDYMSRERRADIMQKVDNFLEALYLAPQIFDQEVFKILKLREKKLDQWRHNFQVIGGGLFLSAYIMSRLSQGFYFKHFVRSFLFTGIFTYAAGRFGEWMGNKLYYKKTVIKLAVAYNISDDEIENIHLKMSETILKENKEDQSRKSSLDNVKFKL